MEVLVLLKAFVINIKKKNNMKSGLYQKYISKEIDPKIKTEKLPEVNLGTIKNKRVNWSDNQKPEPAIKYNNKTYSLQALISD